MAGGQIVGRSTACSLLGFAALSANLRANRRRKPRGKGSVWVGVQHAQIQRARLTQPQRPVAVVAQLIAGDRMHQHVEPAAML